MSLDRKISFRVACSIGKNRFVAHAVMDQKNNSVHLHLYGEMFGIKRMPIQVKNSDLKFNEGKEAELITQILTDHFSGQYLEVMRLEKLNNLEELSITGVPLRIIVRLKAIGRFVK